MRYGFIAYTAIVSMAYAVAHDQLTATISPEYFLLWKGLAGDPTPFRFAVTLVAMRASVGVGLLAGMVLLLANEGLGRSDGAVRVTYGSLLRASLVPLIGATVCAASFGVTNSVLGLGGATIRETVEVAPQRLQAFLTVWAIHIGSYVGALVGLATAAVRVARTPRPLSPSGRAATAV
jgi:hypothetical protein